MSKDPKKMLFDKQLQRLEIMLRPVLIYRSVISKIAQFFLALSVFGFLFTSLVTIFASHRKSESLLGNPGMSERSQSCVYDLCVLGLEKDPFARLQRRFKNDLVFLGPNLAPVTFDQPRELCFWNFSKKKLLMVTQDHSLPLADLIVLDEKLSSHLPKYLFLKCRLSSLDEGGPYVQMSVLEKTEDDLKQVSTWDMPITLHPNADPEFSEKMLTRAKVMWFGEDLFLKNHASSTEKQLQRLDFLGSKPKSHYISADRYLILNEKKEWELVSTDSVPEGESLGGYLKNKVYVELGEVLENGQKLSLNLWPVGGYRKIQVVLDKRSEAENSQEPWDITALKERIKLKGVRSGQIALVQLDKTPMQLRPQDWFLLKEQGGWQKISTVQMVDDFVQGTLRGSLFMVLQVEDKSENPIVNAELAGTTLATTDKHNLGSQTATTSRQQMFLRAFSPGRTLMQDFVVHQKAESFSSTKQDSKQDNSSVKARENSREKSPGAAKDREQAKNKNTHPSQSDDEAKEDEDDFFYWRPEYEEFDEDDVFEGDDPFDKLPELIRGGAGKITPEDLLKMLKNGQKKTKTEPETE